MFIITDPVFQDWMLANVRYDDVKKRAYFDASGGVDMHLFDLIDSGMVEAQDENYRCYVIEESLISRCIA